MWSRKHYFPFNYFSLNNCSSWQALLSQKGTPVHYAAFPRLVYLTNETLNVHCTINQTNTSHTVPTVLYLANIHTSEHMLHVWLITAIACALPYRPSCLFLQYTPAAGSQQLQAWSVGLHKHLSPNGVQVYRPLPLAKPNYSKYHIIYQIKYTVPTTQRMSASDKCLSNTRAVGTKPYKLQPMTCC